LDAKIRTGGLVKLDIFVYLGAGIKNPQPAPGKLKQPNMKFIQAFVAISLFGISGLSFVYPQDWVAFDTANCKILFPVKPEESSQTLNTGLGAVTLYMHTYEVPDDKKDDNMVYSLTETEYPADKISSDKKDMVESFFKSYATGAVNNVHGTLLSETKKEINGYPGSEIRINYNNGLATIVMRSFLVKNKMYIMQVITPPAHDHNKSMEKFMDSFALK
jgi:hypothetical protein